ncbi:MAG: hypothetical protein HFP77_07465 [Methylococcales symbiont of Iophon sp. n. MRB-2018]|nr:MAG: hypothetical protein HFP77_07465 [Methylococcales symbiont of Iophon sp. n. MRB-2018]KAF3979457.1 MAG: hypothetical protein HFP76_07130 [Methylococcales symbiont of Iophon sp. n. MRB-2018]
MKNKTLIQEFLSSKITFLPDNGEIIDWVDRSAIEFQFTVISQHLDFVIEAIEQKQKQLKSISWGFFGTLDDCNEEEKSSLYYSFINGGSSSFGYQYSGINSFSQIQWRSEFLIIYSYFEHTLNNLCYEVQKNQILN